MNALRHGLSYVGCDLIESKDSAHEDLDAYFARQQAISEGLQRVRVERSRMVSELNNISNPTTADQIRLALKRIVAVSRYEGRLYSVRKRHVQAAPPEQVSVLPSMVWASGHQCTLGDAKIRLPQPNPVPGGQAVSGPRSPHPAVFLHPLRVPV